MKSTPILTANTLAATTGIFYIACRILVGLFPGLMFSLAQSWFHGIQLTRLDSASLSLSAFLVGLISAMVGSWLAGYVYVSIRNLMKSS